MAKDESKGQAGAKASTGGFDFSAKESIGFAAWWGPEEGGDAARNVIMGILVACDDPADRIAAGEKITADQFKRYLFRAVVPMTAYRGGGQDLKEEALKEGDHFTISGYNQLEDSFNFYLWSGLQVPLQIRAVQKLTTKNNREVWQWEVFTTPDVQKQLKAKRAEYEALTAHAKASGALPAHAG